MKQREVEFTEEAKADLFNLYDWISAAANPDTALSFVEGLEEFCLGFDLASKRGTERKDIRKGLRIIGYRRRVTIAFTVKTKRVVILRLFYGGQNWTKLFEEPDSQ